MSFYTFDFTCSREYLVVLVFEYQGLHSLEHFIIDVSFAADYLYDDDEYSTFIIHSLRFAGLFSRPAMPRSPLFSLPLRYWNYNLRQILGRNYYSFQLRCSKDCFIIGDCFPRDNTVLFYYNIRRLSSLFTLRRSILTAVMLGLPLFTSLVLSLREIGWGFAPTRHYGFILFHIITSTLFTLRRSILTAVMLGLPLFTSLVLSLREIGFMMFDRSWGNY